MKNLFINLKLIRDLTFFNFFLFVDIFHFHSSFFRLSIVFNFRKFFLFQFRFYSLRFFCKIKDLYNHFLVSLYSLFLVPISESFNSNLFFLFRPFRNSYNFFLNIKNTSLTNFEINTWFLKLTPHLFFKKLNTQYFFPYNLNNSFLKSISYSLNIYYFFLIYLFSGLVS